MKAYFEGAYSSEKSPVVSAHTDLFEETLQFLKSISCDTGPVSYVRVLSFGQFNSCQQCLLIYATTLAPLLQFRRSEEHLYSTLLLEIVS